MSQLIYPNHPDFYQILHSQLPPGWRSAVDSEFTGAFAVRHDSLLIQPLTQSELDDYLWGGEYDELEWLDDADSDC